MPVTTRTTVKGLRRDLSRMVPTGTGHGRVRQRYAVEHFDAVLEIDADLIAALLGVKAASNKKGVSRALHGAVVVRAVNRATKDIS